MSEIVGILATTPIITQVIGAVLVLLFGWFLVSFLAQAMVLVSRLSKIVSGLNGLKNPSRIEPRNPKTEPAPGRRPGVRRRSISFAVISDEARESRGPLLISFKPLARPRR
jgi:hypothetical protein